MNEKEFEKIIKTIDKNITPPQGLKEKMFMQILNQENNVYNPTISKIERFIFEKPLRVACILSTVISGILWAFMGNGYSHILYNVIGIR